MKKIILVIALFFSCFAASAQFTYKIKADSLLVTNDSCTAELNLENSTKNVPGFLFNKGKGRTEFRRALIRLNDSMYLIGGDTLKVAVNNSADAWKLTGNGGTTANHFLGTTNATRLAFRTDNTERAVINQFGDVGIGTSTPIAKLHLYGQNPVLYLEGDQNSYYTGISIKSYGSQGAINNYGVWGTGGINLQTSTAIGGINIGASPSGVISYTTDSTLVTHRIIGAQKQMNDIFRVGKNISGIGGVIVEEPAFVVNKDGNLWSNGTMQFYNPGALAPNIRLGYTGDANGVIYVNNSPNNGALTGAPIIKIDNVTYGWNGGIIDLQSNSGYNYTATVPGGGAALRFIKTAANGGSLTNFGGLYVDHQVNNSSNLENLYTNYAKTRVGGAPGFGYYATAAVLPGGTGTPFAFYADSGYSFFREKVGIGVLPTTASSLKLHVAGNTRFDLGSDATGDVFYRNATGEFNRLPIGTTGQVLTVSSGLPSWGAGGGGAGGWALTGNAATDPATNFLGTTDGQRLVFKTNNAERATIDTLGRVGIGIANPTEKLHVQNGRFKINGTYNISYDGGPLAVIDSGSGNVQYNLAYFKTPNLTDNSRLTLQFGKSSSVYNSGFMSFSKFADGSASNYVEFQIAGFANLLKLHANRNVEIGKTATGLATDDGYRLNVLKSETGLTTEGRVINASTQGATFNTTSGGLTSYGGYYNSNGARSAGANDLTNIGIFATASGGQVNYALKTDGAVNMTNISTSLDTSYKPLAINSNGDIIRRTNWAPDLSNAETFLTSDITLTANTYSDAVSVSLAAGTWMINGSATVESPNNTAQRVTYKIWDGSTVFQAGEASSNSMGASKKGYVAMPASSIVVLTSTTTIKISIASTAASVIKATPGDNNSGTTNKATSFRAVRIK